MWKIHWKGLEWVFRLNGASGNHQHRATLLARLMETQIWCLPADSMRGGLSKRAMASASVSVWEKATSPALILMPDNSVPPF